MNVIGLLFAFLFSSNVYAATDFREIFKSSEIHKQFTFLKGISRPELPKSGQKLDLSQCTKLSDSLAAISGNPLKLVEESLPEQLGVVCAQYMDRFQFVGEAKFSKATLYEKVGVTAAGMAYDKILFVDYAYLILNYDPGEVFYIDSKKGLVVQMWQTSLRKGHQLLMASSSGELFTKEEYFTYLTMNGVLVFPTFQGYAIDYHSADRKIHGSAFYKDEKKRFRTSFAAVINNQVFQVKQDIKDGKENCFVGRVLNSQGKAIEYQPDSASFAACALD